MQMKKPMVAVSGALRSIETVPSLCFRPVDDRDLHFVQRLIGAGDGMKFAVAGTTITIASIII